MRKTYVFLIIVLLSSYNSIAQELEKVKGDRNLTIRQTPVDEFSKLVVGEEFEMELFYSKTPSVEIETDDNLHEYIAIEVINGILTLKTTRELRAKDMKVKINYGDTFSDIEVFGDAEIRSLTSLELKNANIKATGSSRAYLNIKSDTFKFVGLEKVKARLNVTATSAIIEMSDNAKADALINATEIKADLYQRANADFEGTAVNLAVRADNNAQFNGRNLTAKTCTVIAEIASDVYVEVTDQITIETSGSSEIYLYGNAKILINRFTDTVKLEKKEK
ncbi:GIN domain-containing protein [Sediminibacter sp. Hel_I_10]|uniref:GIN domain-containing protein n=1 Tax=Sediminibacter sp. Hel_I_10 TaxID=1392490 RepID=UPI0009DD2823|nr:DUF2807 domain-containing protein [Sediminibacter sp. Hel_I_10]